MVVNRIAQPTSKYGLLDWLKFSATPLLLGFPPHGLHENLFYRAMDRLGSRQDALERRVYDRVVRPMTSETPVIYRDLTSSYHEGRRETLVRYGYNRDRVEGCPQVNWGMVVTPEGFPITLQAYPGNTTDVTTVVGMREHLQRVFGLRSGIYVGDRGMLSEEVVRDLTQHGFDWVLAETTSDVEDVLAAVSKSPIVAVSERQEVREGVGKDGRRFVVLFNEERRKEILDVLEHRLSQGQAIVESIRRGWARNPDRSPTAVLKQAVRALAEKGLTDLYDVDVDLATVNVLLTRMKDKVRRLRRWAGWWVLATSTDLPAEEVARLYLGLTVIERDWRELRSVLEVRPLNHRLDRRIRAHLLVCELALLLERFVDAKVKKARLNEEGRLLTGPRAVARFENVMLSQAELATTGITRLVVTEPGPQHLEVLKAVGLDEARFRQGWERLD